jgi:hypothetical protein
MNTTPEFDKGFFASVPRIIRTGYDHLSATAKWIYVCLKDLCGENGTCYRTLRTLAREIGVSTGVLSQTIKDLAGAGLITAEKKQRPGQSTKGMWHICIVNIWKVNGEHHPTRKCSPGEQTAIRECSSGEYSHSEDGASPKNVHQVNGYVHYMNIPPLECSPDEKECSRNETKEEEFKKYHFEERSVEEESDDPPQSSSDLSSSHSSSENDSQNKCNNVPVVLHEDVLSSEVYLLQGGVTNHPASVGVPRSGTDMSPVDSGDTHVQEVSSSPGGDPLSPDPLGDLPVVKQKGTTQEEQAACVKDAQQSVMENDTSSGKSRARKQKRASDEKPSGPPQMPDTNMTWGTHKCMQLFDAWRGCLLIGKHEIMQASSYAKGLAEQYSEYQIRAVRDAMNKDPYWMKQGGVDIGNVARNIHKYIKMVPKVEVPSLPEQMTSSEAIRLANKAVGMAKAEGHDIDAVPGENSIVIHWNTRHFEQPETFESESHFMQSFTEMCEIWRYESQKKKAVI